MINEPNDDPDRIDHISVGNGLKVVPEPDQGHQPKLNPELKATLDEMNRRYRVQRERTAAEDETPDAI